MKFILFLVGSLILSLTAGAQTDTTFLTKAKQKAIADYNASIGDQANLFNGSEYKEYVTRPDTEGNPYFSSDDWIDGNVFYDSGLYTNVPLMYDLITDKLVLDQLVSHFKLELISEKILYFEMAGHKFVRVSGVKGDSTVRAGFYDLLYDGKVKAFAKRHKEIKETPMPTGLRVDYLDKNSYYILKDNKYYEVKSKGSVYKVFSDRKKALRRLARSHSKEIDFKNNRDQAVTTLSRLYDESAAQQ